MEELQTKEAVLAEDNVQQQIDEINRKLDIVLEEVIAQRETRTAAEDLVADLTLVGNDLFRSTVTELDKAGVELNSEDVTQFFLRLLRNVNTMNEMFMMLESANDLIKDVTPVLHQVGLDGIHLMNDLEQKGYIDFIREAGKIIDNIVTHFTVEDVKLLADNITSILETVKSLTQPEMLKAINSGLVVYKSIEIDDVEEYSMWKAIRAMNSKEMKKGIGFLITFLQNIARETEKAKANT